MKAPAAGSVQDVYYEAGEVASAGAPVISLLPPDRRKVIFFVPEPARPGLAIGEELAISCDSCPAGLTARLSFLAREAEFTPPVIYSRDTRDKLVFRAEALLSGAAAGLPLGQPVEVAPAAGGRVMNAAARAGHRRARPDQALRRRAPSSTTST